MAVYVDFDNVAISRYDELHGEKSFRDDRAGGRNVTSIVRQRLTEARLDITAIMDHAASVGPVAISRAYADWSNAVSASYSFDMMRHAIDLVQLFPFSGTKNGADIRLAIDVIDDLARYPHISTVIIVAGDSDYVALAQRCKRLGRRVIGVGITGSVSRHWEAACDEFRYYGSTLEADGAAPLLATGAVAAPQPGSVDPGPLLVRALRLEHQRASGDWVHAAALKNLMRRLEPAFDEGADGFRSFTDFLASHDGIVAIQRTDSGTLVQLKERDRTDRSLATPSEALPVGRTEAEKLRKHLNLGAGMIVTPELEALGLQAVHIAWDLCDPASGVVHSTTPTADVRMRLTAEGVADDVAKRAAQLALMFHPTLLRDHDMRLQPNPELLGLGDGDLGRLIRSGMAERIRSREDGASASAATIVEAIHGPDPAPELVAEYESYCAVTSVRQLSESLRPVLIPAPVLWDVAEAFIDVPATAAISSVDALRAHLEAPLGRMERDLDTVPMQAVFSSLVEGQAVVEKDGALHSAMVGAKYTDVAAAIIRGWYARCDPTSFNVEPFYRIVLPDRFQMDWRRWVRSIIGR